MDRMMSEHCSQKNYESISISQTGPGNTLRSNKDPQRTKPVLLHVIVFCQHQPHSLHKPKIALADILCLFTFCSYSV